VTDDITRAAANADSLVGGFLVAQASGSDRFASVRNEHRGNAEVLSRIATKESKRNLSSAREKKSNEEVRRERHERMRGQALRNYYEQTRDAAARIITVVCCENKHYH
jgi:DNA-binding helix-hairpin-helix protein with protein kinase domain